MSTPGAPMAGPPSAAQIGRRFSLVNAIPALTLILFVALLLASGAPDNAPNAHSAADALGRLDAVGFVLLVLGATMLGLFLSPFQVALVQFLEGYWPPHGPIGIAAHRRRERHRLRRRELKRLAVHSAPLTRWEQRHPYLIAERQAAAKRRLKELPYDDNRVLPTRLGNMLRRHEDLAGDRYGLDALEVIPRLYPVAPAAMIEMIEDARNEMDVMAAFVLTWILATGISLYLLHDHPVWLFVPLATYGLAYASYRACVVAAGVYGRTLMRAIDLYRFDLIEQLRLTPATHPGEEEAAANRALTDNLTGEAILAGEARRHPLLSRYKHPGEDAEKGDG